MKIMLMKSMFMNSIILIFLKTPIPMMMMLLLQTIMSVLLMNMMYLSSWFAMITFLMMIGSLMIIFMYISSISSNEKMKMNMKMYLPIAIIMIMTEEFIVEIQINENEEVLMTNNEEMSMTKMYSKSFYITIMMVMYLLMTMICINKIINNFKGPLREIKYE